MGRRFPGSAGGGGGGGGGGAIGPRNATEMFVADGTFTWTLPSDFDDTVSMVVRCWGAGGCNGNSGAGGNGYGGGGGGLALGEISTLSAGDTLTIVVGQGARVYDGIGGSSSLADAAGNVFMSSTGGNSGFNTTANQGSAVAGEGGLGISGTVTCTNRRGGRGGQGYMVATSGYGGGGGSAPHPDGFMDGKRGGDCGSSYTGASGASINFPGLTPYTTNSTPGGSGTAGMGTSDLSKSTYYGYGGSGGAGILGAGGHGACSNSYSNTSVTSDNAGDGKGHAIWGPNNILLGGGGGGGSAATLQSSEKAAGNAGCGGPGAGGGAAGGYAGAVFYVNAGSGGILGGGGGAGAECIPGGGGNAGGGGGSGYGSYPTATVNHGWGGNGLVFIQYKVTF